MPQPLKKLWKTFFKYWMKFAGVLGKINGFIILTVLYVVVFGIYAICHFAYVMVHRLVSLFRERVPPQQGSFWIEKPYQKETLETMRRQF